MDYSRHYMASTGTTPAGPSKGSAHAQFVAQQKSKDKFFQNLTMSSGKSIAEASRARKNFFEKIFGNF